VPKFKKEERETSVFKPSGKLGKEQGGFRKSKKLLSYCRQVTFKKVNHRTEQVVSGGTLELSAKKKHRREKRGVQSPAAKMRRKIRFIGRWQMGGGAINPDRSGGGTQSRHSGTRDKNLFDLNRGGARRVWKMESKTADECSGKKWGLLLHEKGGRITF